MSVLDRDALESSPLADLHTIAGELSIDSFRRLRKDDLIEKIIARQDGRAVSDDADPEDAPSAETATEEDEPSASSRSRSRGRSRSRRSRGGAQSSDAAAASEDSEDDKDESPAPAPSGRRLRGSGASAKATAPAKSGREKSDKSDKADKADKAEPQPEAEEVVEGVVELLGNGSGFIRTSPPEASENDIYISAAQVKRCELVSGDRVSGPKRPPRRSERFASLIRVDTINGRPASEVSEGARYDELPAAFPADRFRFGSDDETLKAIEFLTPIGRGSRVSIVGGPRAGKSHALRSLAEVLSGVEGLQLFVALAGIRPEEISEWPREGALVPSATLSLAASPDALDHLVELVIDQARRLAARGADTVVLIDSLDGLHPHAARKALAAARNIVDGGSLTVIATSSLPVGGETTVIALDPLLAAAARFPAIDLVASGTIRPELLVGDAGAQAIAEARAQALDRA